MSLQPIFAQVALRGDFRRLGRRLVRPDHLPRGVDMETYATTRDPAVQSMPGGFAERLRGTSVVRHRTDGNDHVCGAGRDFTDQRVAYAGPVAKIEKAVRNRWIDCIGRVRATYAATRDPALRSLPGGLAEGLLGTSVVRHRTDRNDHVCGAGRDFTDQRVAYTGPVTKIEKAVGNRWIDGVLLLG